MKLSPLKFAFATSLIVHGTIFSAAYTVWHGRLSNEPFAPSEARMAEMVIELEHAGSGVSEPEPAVVKPAPAIEPVESMTAPADVPSPVADPVDLIPIDQPVPSPAVSSPVQSGTPASSESIFASEAPANSAPAFVDGQAGYLICPKPAYPREARRRRQEGLVLLTASISAGGFPEEVLIKQSSGADILDKAALETVRRWQFAPALVRSKAASSQVEIPIRFRLSK